MGREDFAQRVAGAMQTRRRHEDARMRARALACVPLERLLREAGVDGERLEAATAEQRDAVARGLLAWFKGEFFTWTDALPCPECGGKSRVEGMAPPLDEDVRFGASRVEVHVCDACNVWQRFPRYNDPGKLLETRRGRCGEWANCFCLVARAVGFEVRYVSDWTDHVWAELWSAALGRWVHADSCENAFDTPLMYEQGWGKKLNYIVAIGVDHVVDITRKYSKDYGQNVMPQRTQLAEEDLLEELGRCHAQQARWAGSSAPPARETLRRLLEEQVVMFFQNGAQALKPGEAQGRISGDAAWRRMRGEDGARGAGN